MKQKTIKAARALWECMKEEGYEQGNLYVGNSVFHTAGKKGWNKDRIILDDYPDPIKPETTDYPQTLLDLVEWIRKYEEENSRASIQIFHNGEFHVLDEVNEILLEGNEITTDLPQIKPDHVVSFLNANGGYLPENELKRLAEFRDYLTDNDLLK